VAKFENRQVATVRIWKAIQDLNGTAGGPVPTGALEAAAKVDAPKEKKAPKAKPADAAQKASTPAKKESLNLYGRSIGSAFPHRFLPRPKGGLFAWESVNQVSTVILVEGLFDLAVLWQAGFRNTTCAFGTHLTPAQFSQLCDRRGRQLYIAFDCDTNHAGQQSAVALAQRLKGAGLQVRIVGLPDGHDPNSYFVAGATAADFARCLDRAHSLQL